jgi:hypothetical protein
MRYTKEIRNLNEKSKTYRVKTVIGDTYFVETPSGRVYKVGVRKGCNCEWAFHGGTGCSHQLAAIRFYLMNKGWREVSFWPTREAAARQHKHIVPWRNLFVTGSVGRR